MIIITIFFAEDTSKPRFATDERGGVMKKVNPAVLHVQRTDKTTLKAVQLFARQVVVVLHTCNDSEYWAALERMEPPTAEDGSNIRDHAVKCPGTPSVIGWFGGYRAAVVRTEQGNKCRDELTKALTESFPNAQVIIGAGIAYANNRERRFADVLISDQIENFVQYKIVDGKITNRGPREQIDPNVQRIFKKPAGDWTSIRPFHCADNDRPSKAHIGCIVSAPTLVRDEALKVQLMKHTPDCIGGEMEGWVLLEMKRALSFRCKRNVEVIIIKSVADYGDCRKGDDWQWTAAKAAMDCIHYCLETTGGTEFNGKESFSNMCKINMNSSKITSLQNNSTTE